MSIEGASTAWTGTIGRIPHLQMGFRGQSNVKKITSKLEQWAIAALHRLDIEATTDERMQGVWVEGSKIGSVGLAFMRGSPVMDSQSIMQPQRACRDSRWLRIERWDNHLIGPIGIYHFRR